jgi:hypothetical protein
LETVASATQEHFADYVSEAIYCIGQIVASADAFIARLYEAKALPTITKFIKNYTKPVSKILTVDDIDPKYLPQDGTFLEQSIGRFFRIRLTTTIRAIGLHIMEYDSAIWADLGLLSILDSVARVSGTVDEGQAEITASGFPATAILEVITHLLKEIQIVKRIFGLLIPQRNGLSIFYIMKTFGRLASLAEIAQFHSLLPLIYKQSDVTAVRLEIPRHVFSPKSSH